MNKARLDIICEKAIRAAIQESEFLQEGSLRVLLVEGIDEEDQSELAKHAEEAQKMLKQFISVLPEEMYNTKQYFTKLHNEIPHPGEILSIDLFGNKKQTAKQVVALSSIIEQVDNAQLSIINAFSMIKKFISAASKGIKRDGGKLSLNLTPASYVNLDDAIWDLDQFRKLIDKSFVKPKSGGFIAKAMRKIGDWWKKNVEKTPTLMNADDFAEDIFRMKFNQLLSVGKKIESLREKVDIDKNGVADALEKIDSKISSDITEPKESKPTRSPIAPVKVKPEDKKVAGVVARAKTRAKPTPVKKITPPQPEPRKKVKVLGDIVNYRDPENRDKGFVYTEPKGVDLMNAISMMSKNPNAKSRAAFKDALNAVVGEEIFESKKSKDDIIVEKWRRLAGIES
jgi:hypothetical protein